MSKILVINDPHIADTPPSSRTSDYQERIFEKLAECMNIAVEENCTHTLFTGDIFHSPTRVSHALVSRVMALFDVWPTEILAIAGNHDLSTAGIKAIKNQPIHTLATAKVIKLLHDDAITLDGNTLLVLFSYDNNDMKKYQIKRNNGVKNQILVTHDMMLPKADYPYPFYIPQEDVAETSNFDLIIYGHVHYDFGINKHYNTHFLSAGSLARVSRSDENGRKGKMRVAIVEINDDKIDFSFRRLTTVRDYDTVFLERKQIAPEVQMFSEYIDKISDYKPETINLDDYVEDLDIEYVLKQRIKEYLYSE